MFRSLACATAVAFAAGAADAATIEIQSVTGTWEIISVLGDPPVSGEGTSLVQWGTPFRGYTEQSGYLFEATTEFGPYEPFEVFEVGTFTHLNKVISSPDELTSARLSITMTAVFDGLVKTFTSSFDFGHWETNNTARRCANGEPNGIGVNINGCADRVQLLSNPSLVDVFKIGDLTYTFELTGFLWGSDFWTIERQDNSAPLFAQFFVRDDRIDPPPPPVVPLPGAIWGMVAGLGGLWAMRRRKS